MPEKLEDVLHAVAVVVGPRHAGDHRQKVQHVEHLPELHNLRANMVLP